VIKSLLNNVYYYQDKLGSTTHVANASGQLLESYRYDLYGTPSYFNESTQPSQPINSSTVGVADLYAGERWIPDLGLYDLRNRFMSPELGRFLQPDPIGFKGDAGNLYRYCHNDPEDFSDPTGLREDTPEILTKPNLTSLGEGDWKRQGSPFTNGELLTKAKAYVAEIRDIVKRYVDKANKGSPNVKWDAKFSNNLVGPENFKNPKAIAKTDWYTKTTAVMYGGTVAGFNINLQINISWNDSKVSYFGSALALKPFGFNKTGEYEHSRDALNALSSPYGIARSANVIANEQAAGMVGQSIPADAAASRMNDALRGWTKATTDQSRLDHDLPFGDHWY
jgi:RHS repeat-associated protein